MSQDNSIDTVEVRKEYYASGALYSETPLVNGKKHGIARAYYESGALLWVIPYVNGQRHGIEKTYYSSGALWWETPYVNEQRHGIAKSYNKDDLNIDFLKLYRRDRAVLVLCL